MSKVLIDEVEEISIEPSISELKTFIINDGNNKMIKYCKSFKENQLPCSLIITDHLSHGINFQHDSYTRIFTICADYLAYIIFSRANTSTVVKITHLKSKNYYVLKSFKGSIQSVLFYETNLCYLGVLDNRSTMDIYLVSYKDDFVCVENIFNCEDIINASYQLTKDLTFNFTWEISNKLSKTDNDLSLLIWRVDGVCKIINFSQQEDLSNKLLIKSDIIFNVASIIPIFVTMGYYMKEFSTVILAFNDGSIKFYSIENSSSFEKGSICAFDGFPVKAFNVVQNDSEVLSLESYSLVVYSEHIIKVISLTTYQTSQILIFDSSSKLLPSVTDPILSLSFIDLQFKILMIGNLKFGERLEIKTLIAYPITTETIAFGSKPLIYKDQSDFFIYEYHRTGLRCLNISKKVHSSTIEHNNINQTPPPLNWFASNCKDNMHKNEEIFETMEILIEKPEAITPPISSLNASLPKVTSICDSNNNISEESIEEKKHINNINPLINSSATELDRCSLPILMENINLLKKSMEAISDRHSELLFSQINKKYDCIKKQIDNLSKNFSTKLQSIETRLKNMEESKIKDNEPLERNLEPFKSPELAKLRTYGSKSKTANSCFNPYAFPSTEKQKKTEDIVGIEKLMMENIQVILTSKDFFNRLLPNLQEGFKVIFNEHLNGTIVSLLMPKIEKELKNAFETVNNTFNIGTKQYLNSLESHLSKFEKCHKESTPLSSTMLRYQIENTLNCTHEKTSIILSKKVDELANNLFKRLDTFVSSDLENKFISAIRKEWNNSSFSNDKNLIILQNEIKGMILKNELTKALSLIIQSKNKDTLNNFMEEVSAIELFEQINTQSISATTILEFLKLLTPDVIKLNVSKSFEYLQETLLSLQCIDKQNIENEIRKTVLETQWRLNSLKSVIVDKSQLRSILLLTSLCQSCINGI